jgi:glycosyltransferase involved in cell wall biosynthesis
MSDLSKKNIYINGRFFSRRITGIERYAREITTELDKLVTPEDNIKIVVPDISKVDIDYKNIKVIENKSHTKGFYWDYLTFPFYVKKQNGFAVHLCNLPVIFTKSMTVLHDVAYRARPSFFRKKTVLLNRLNYWYITHFSKKIVTDSLFSKSEIQRFYKTKPTKDIDIIYCGWEHTLGIHDGSDTFIKYSFLKKYSYYFSMATLSKHKNFEWILKVAEKHPQQLFAIAGGGDLKDVAGEMGYDKLTNVFFLGYVTDEDAKSLMKYCKAFIFPTLYEGFGLPPLEAVSYGAKHIIVSDTPCMREVYKQYASYVDPLDYSGMANINDLAEVDAEKLLGLYSWKKSAEKLYEVFANL